MLPLSSFLLAFLFRDTLASAYSPFSVAKSFSEHAVLQSAPRTARVWGWTTASGVVTATLNCSSVSVSASFNVTASPDDGLWIAEFPPVPGSTHPCVVSFTDITSSASVWFLDIVFGEVLVCGGQSCVRRRCVWRRRYTAYEPIVAAPCAAAVATLTLGCAAARSALRSSSLRSLMLYIPRLPPRV